MKSPPTHTTPYLTCGAWLIRFLSWALITAAFVLSILALSSCTFVQGTALRSLDTAYPDGETFSLGVSSAQLGSVASYGCIPYTNDAIKEFLGRGAPELLALIFGILATFLGAVSIIVCFVLKPTEARKRIFGIRFAFCLFTAATFQALTFILFASNHCDSEYWDQILSQPVNMTRAVTPSVSCVVGQGGWMSLFAIILYIFAGLLVLKWVQPEFTLVNIRWPSQDSCNIAATMSFGDVENQQKLKPQPSPGHTVSLSQTEEDDLQKVEAAVEEKDIEKQVVDRPRRLMRDESGSSFRFQVMHRTEDRATGDPQLEMADPDYTDEPWSFPAVSTIAPTC